MFSFSIIRAPKNVIPQPTLAAELRLRHWKAVRDPMCTCDYCQYRWSADTLFFTSGSSAGLIMDRSDFQCLIKRMTVTWVDDPFGDWKKLNNYPDGVEFLREPPVCLLTGYNCTRCNEKNDYAAANQKDGTYVCFNCR